MAEISFEELRRIQMKEKSEPQLSALPEDFYEKVNEHVAQWKERLQAKFSIAEAREYENTLKILRDIYSKREQKILLKALKAAKSEEDAPGLAREERKLFDSVVGLLKESVTRFEGLLEVSEMAKALEHSKHVKIVQDVPEFVGKDFHNYGPFKLGQDVTLPNEEAERLAKLGMAHME